MIAAMQKAAEVFSANDLEGYAACITDDFISDNVSRTPVDKEAFLEHCTKYFKAFPGIKNYQKALLPAGNFLVFDECTFTIPLPDSDATIEIFHMDIVEIDGNKMKVKTTFGDGALMNVALGRIEPPVPLPPDAPTFAVPAPKPNRLKPAKAQEAFQNRWNEHDLVSLAEMVQEDAVILVSPLLDPVGRDAYLGWQELLFRAFPDARMTTVRSFSGDGWAVSEITLKGTNTGPYIDHPATGKGIELRAGYLTRYDRKGLITNLKFFMNSMVIMGQLELEPVKIATKS
jgi:predicted ester cyclase